MEQEFRSIIVEILEVLVSSSSPLSLYYGRCLDAVSMDAVPWDPWEGAGAGLSLSEGVCTSYLEEREKGSLRSLSQ